MNRHSERRLAKLTKAYVASDAFHVASATVVTEIRTLQGRPDLVLLINDGFEVKRSFIRRAGLAMASHTAARILAWLHSRKRSKIDRLYREINATKRSVDSALSRLRHADLLDDRVGVVTKTDLLITLTVPIWAIEVKREISWRAVFQAQQYRSFASRSMIACWDNGDANGAGQNAAEISALGIIAIQDDGDVHLLRRGRSASPRNLVAYYYALGNAYSGRAVAHSGFTI